MASAPPLSEIVTRDRLISWGVLAIGWLATAVLTAFFTYMLTSRLNNEAVIQQQYLAAVQDFTATGAKVDASITELADTIIDEDSVTVARKEARQAIAAHVAATDSLSQVVGKGNSDAYMDGLATLTKLVDKTDDVPAALSTSRARFDLMSNRTIIVAEARRRIYGHT